MDFNQYKNRLFDYLHIMGIEAHRGLVRCINPAHEDHNPSCELWEDHFKCYSGSCGCSGDIYDAVELLEGITSKAEQYKHLEKIFGGTYTPRPVEKKETEVEEKPKFTPDYEAVKTVDKYLDFGWAPEEALLDFLSQRCTKTTHGEFKQYPAEVIENLKKYFGYWPGMDIALQDLGNNTIYRSGIPTKSNQNGQYAWAHSGLVLKIGTGYKLHYYQDGKCEKRGSLSCSTFPTPNDLSETLQDEPVILVEGELDAIMCRAAGISNVFSCGGTNGLTKPKIKAHLVNVKKIVILFDNDEAGKIAAGLKAAKAANLPKKLLQAGYNGEIYIAELKDYKDPDECICYQRIDLISKAIESAVKYENITVSADIKTEKEIPAGKTNKNSTLSTKDLKALIRTLKASKIENDEFNKALGAMLLICEEKQEDKDILVDAGLAVRWLDHKKDIDIKPTYLSSLASKYLSYYWQRKLKGIVLPELQHNEFSNKPLVRINFKELMGSDELNRFINYKGERSAAILVAKVLKDRFMYVEDEKRFYYFNGHVWNRESNIMGIIYNILTPLITYYSENYEDYYKTEKPKTLYETIGKCRNAIEQKKFLSAVAKIFSELPSVFKETITFDGPQIQETLTLEDGVLDFTGKTLKIREAYPDEYRYRILPYKVDDVVDSKKPTNFLKFMHSNFKNEETLKTLFYYLSLIPSRCAQYKVGGIFIGTGGTGKTTTMKIISDLYPNMTTPIPRQVIMLNKDIRNYGGGATPEIAELEGMGAGISDETQRNDMLNSAVFKQLTGGGVMKARRLYANTKEFKPTAQTIILTNYLPRFDNKDPATIDRMVVIPFSVQHKRGEDDNFKDENDIFNLLRPEYPAIVKLFAEYYIHLKNDYKGKIPLSDECKSYKDDYVEDQATDLDRFVKENIEFVQDENVFVKVKELYARYCEINDIELNDKGQPVDKEAWSQSKLTHFLKSDYTEIHIKQKRFGGSPEQIIIKMRLKENPNIKKPETKEEVKAENKPAPKPAVTQQQLPLSKIPAPEDNPFEDDEGPDYDIF